MVNRPIEQDLGFNFSVRGWNGFERNGLTCLWVYAGKHSKACRPLAGVLDALGEIKVERSLAVTTRRQESSTEARSCARGPIKADFSASKD